MVRNSHDAYSGNHVESSRDLRTFVDLFYGTVETKGIYLTLSKQSSNEATSESHGIIEGFGLEET